MSWARGCKLFQFFKHSKQQERKMSKMDPERGSSNTPKYLFQPKQMLHLGLQMLGTAPVGARAWAAVRTTASCLWAGTGKAGGLPGGQLIGLTCLKSSQLLTAWSPARVCTQCHELESHSWHQGLRATQNPSCRVYVTIKPPEPMTYWKALVQKERPERQAPTSFIGGRSEAQHMMA